MPNCVLACEPDPLDGLNWSAPKSDDETGGRDAREPRECQRYRDAAYLCPYNGCYPPGGD